MKIKNVLDELSPHIHKSDISKHSDSKYFIKTDLVLAVSNEIIGIILVEINGISYFADYGHTLSAYDIDYDELDNKIKDKILKYASDNGIKFEAGKLLCEITNPCVDFNNFKRAIILIEELL